MIKPTSLLLILCLLAINAIAAGKPVKEVIKKKKVVKSNNSQNWLDAEQQRTVALICAAVKASKHTLPNCTKKETAKILCGMSLRESSLRPKACNGIAFGAFAFKPATTRLVAKKLGYKFNPNNPRQAAEATLRLMNDDLKRVKNPTVELACIGHNCGGPAMWKAAKMSPEQRQKFLKGKDGGHAASYYPKVKAAAERLGPLVEKHFR